MSKLSLKLDLPTSVVANYVRTKISFELVKSQVMCLRGSRSKKKLNVEVSEMEVVNCVSRMPEGWTIGGVVKTLLWTCDEFYPWYYNQWWWKMLMLFYLWFSFNYMPWWCDVICLLAFKYTNLTKMLWKKIYPGRLHLETCSQLMDYRIYSKPKLRNRG